MLIRIIFGSLFILLAFASFIAPIIQTYFGYPTGEGIYSFLSPICHQYPTRSFWIVNRPFALCSRCFSGYLGLGFGLLFIHQYFKCFKNIIFGILLLIPGIADGLLQLWTEYESTNILRFITGALGGLGVFYIICPINFLKK